MKLTVTDIAKQKVLEVQNTENRRGDGLRILVNGGGTPQVEYALNFVAAGEEQADDVVVDVGEFKVHVAKDDVQYLQEATLDFVDRLTESGFKVDAPNAGPPRPEGPLAEAVQKVITDKINPAVASHGGVVHLVGLRDNVAYLEFGGGCQGCGMINVTLKQGVEVMIKEDVPEIVGVMDVTDHANGTNPYYKPGK